MTKKKLTDHPESVLMRRTQELLRQSNKTQFEIYDATGIQPNWQTKFVRDAIPDPGIRRVEALYTYLHGSALDLR